MGKANQGVFGAWVNKVGNVVGRIRQGQNVYSIYQPNVANPKTPNQVKFRAVFSLLTKRGSSLLNAIKVGFKSLDGYKFGSAFSSFVGYNYKKAVAWSYSTLEGAKILYDKLMLSVGPVPLPLNPTGTLDGMDISVTWTDNSGQGSADAADKACMCLFCEALDACVFEQDLANRSDRSSILTAPASWSGRSLEAYIFFTNKDGLTSDSSYLGTFNL